MTTQLDEDICIWNFVAAVYFAQLVANDERRS